MIIGNGSKNQFRYINDVKRVLKEFLKSVPNKSSFLYFGDASNSKKPDIGYVFDLLRKYRPDISIYMIQISEAKSWGVPKFVTDVYWHSDYTKKCKWGGCHNGKPCSNTKKWVNIAKRIGIDEILVLGGGEITLDEMKLARKFHIKLEYVPIERRFKGDGKTRVKDSDSEKEKIGITY
jgi:hypothetical protein